MAASKDGQHPATERLFVAGKQAKHYREDGLPRRWWHHAYVLHRASCTPGALPTCATSRQPGRLLAQEGHKVLASRRQQRRRLGGGTHGGNESVAWGWTRFRLHVEHSTARREPLLRTGGAPSGKGDARRLCACSAGFCVLACFFSSDLEPQQTPCMFRVSERLPSACLPGRRGVSRH